MSEAKHRYQSDPAPAPLGTDTRRFPKGPALSSDGLNRLSDFPFEPLERHMWEACNGELAIEAAEKIVDALGLTDVVETAGLSDTLDGGSADCGAQKGFSFARTTLAKGVAVDVYNLHADAGGGVNDFEARAANFVQLAEFINKHSAGRAVIVGGDMNLRTGSDAVRPADVQIWNKFRADTGVSDVCDAVACGADFWRVEKFGFRSGNGIPLKPLTHRFEREKFTREDGEPLSDHPPLAVTFRWQAKR